MNDTIRRVKPAAVTSEHRVQLFDTRESLADSVAAFLHEGFAAGERLFVVAKLHNVDRIAPALGRRGCDVAAATADRRIVVLDAAVTLAQISVDGQPKAHLFDRVIGARVRELSAGASVRAYGEMVDLLAEQEGYEAALKIEEMCNGLTEQCSLRLLCGYSSAHFAPATHESILRRICHAHTSARAEADDALGEWLLSGACP